jgi:hypothetical protein
MAKVGFKGLKNAKSAGGNFPVYDKGDYLVECTKMNYDDGEAKGKAPSFFFQGTVRRGPEQTDGSDPTEGKMSAFFNIEAGGQYEEIQLGVLKGLCDAFEVPVGKDDSINPDLFVGKTGTMRAVVKTNNRTGEPLNNWYGVEPSKSKYKDE